MILALFCLTYLAFALLALSMFSHFRACFKRAPSDKQSMLLQVSGGSTLSMSYMGTVYHWGLGYGSTVFIGMMTLSALMVILTLSYRPKQLTALLLLSALMGGVMFIDALLQ